MKIPGYAAAIGLDARALSAVGALHMPDAVCAELKELFYTDFDAFSSMAKQTEDPNLTVLGVYLALTEDMRARYAERGIDDGAFMENLRDLTIWTDDYREKTGRSGLAEWGWLAMSLKMEVIRLGRLQFQPIKAPRDIDAGNHIIPEGTPMLAVHIPAGEPLAPAGVRESFRRAPGFFRKHFGAEYDMYHCHSWLLSPVLDELLPAGSAILEFQKNFRIYETDPSRQAEERVFGIVSDDFAGYPERTSLQRSLKKHLLAGNTVPAGAGTGRFGDR